MVRYDKVNEKKRNLEKVVIITFSLLCAMMLTMTFANCAVDKYNSNFAEIFDNLRMSLSGKSLISTILMITFYKLGVKRYEKELPCKYVFMVLSLLLSCIWLMGESFRIDNSLSHIVETSGQIFKSVVYLLGVAYLIFEGIALFNHIIDCERFVKNKSDNKVMQFVDKNIMIVVPVSLLIFWSVSVITSYPANMCSDAWIQLSQFWGCSVFTSHHPPMYALLTGFFTWIGYIAGNANSGLFLFVLFQTILYAAIIGYSFVLLRKIKAPRWLMVVYFIIVAITPHYVNGVSLVLKDNLYSLFVVLFIIELIYALIDINEFIKKPYHYLLSFFSILGVIWFRNNGKYIIYPLFSLIILLLFVKRKNFSKQIIIHLTSLMLCSVIVASLINSCVVKAYDIQPGSKAEMFSLPFQQTARTVLEHGGEITSDEKEAINSVLKYDELAENYNPIISDPIKARVQEGVTMSDFLNYVKVWAKMFFKYPMAYVKATVNQNYILVFPFQENNTVYVKFEGVYEDEMAQLKDKIGLQEVTAFDNPKEGVLYWDYWLFSSPVVGVLSHGSLYVLVLIVTVMIADFKKKYKFLITALPILLSLFVVILAPVIINSPRYAFPVTYSMPILLAYYIYLVNHDGRKTNKH